MGESITTGKSFQSVVETSPDSGVLNNLLADKERGPLVSAAWDIHQASLLMLPSVEQLAPIIFQFLCPVVEPPIPVIYSMDGGHTTPESKEHYGQIVDRLLDGTAGVVTVGEAYVSGHERPKTEVAITTLYFGSPRLSNAVYMITNIIPGRRSGRTEVLVVHAKGRMCPNLPDEQ